eukprot:scaffold10104_cov91-Skeletonema_marinoi.AAC.2
MIQLLRDVNLRTVTSRIAFHLKTSSAKAAWDGISTRADMTIDTRRNIDAPHGYMLLRLSDNH